MALAWVDHPGDEILPDVRFAQQATDTFNGDTPRTI
jgi:hypothetical protein